MHLTIRRQLPIRFARLLALGAIATPLMLWSGGAATASAASSVVSTFVCVAGAENTDPTVDPSELTSDSRHVPDCPAGEVAQPLPERGSPKGFPGLKSVGAAQPAIQPPALNGGCCFLYNAVNQSFPNGGVTRGRGFFGQYQPFVFQDPSNNNFGHSLAELAAVWTIPNPDPSQPALQEIVEVGWTVDPANPANASAPTSPHLFVFYWVDNQPAPLNGGNYDAGFVSTSSSWAPGDVVETTVGPQAYAIQSGKNCKPGSSSGSNSPQCWWILYQGKKIGFFPASLWGGHFSTALQRLAWFGEVAYTQAQVPVTAMGTGAFGTAKGAAVVKRMAYTDASGVHTAAGTEDMTPTSYNPQYYAFGSSFDGSSFAYGGPGGVVRESLSNVAFYDGGSASGSFDLSSSFRVTNSTVVLADPSLGTPLQLNNPISSIIFHASSSPPFYETVLIAAGETPTGTCTMQASCGATYASLNTLTFPGMQGGLPYQLLCNLCGNGNNTDTSWVTVVSPYPNGAQHGATLLMPAFLTVSAGP